MGRRFICDDIIHKADPEHESDTPYFPHNVSESAFYIPQLAANKTYEIVWDNESYTLLTFENICQKEESEYKVIFLGNDSLLLQFDPEYIPTEKNTEYPFCFGTFLSEEDVPFFAYVLPEEDSNDHVFSIYEITDENKNIYFRNSDALQYDSSYWSLGPCVQEGDEFYVSVNGGSDVVYKVQRDGDYFFMGDLGVLSEEPISDDSFLIVIIYGYIWGAMNAQFTEFDFEVFRPCLPDDIILKDSSGVAQTYSKAQNLVFDSSQEGVENVYSHGNNDGALNITSLDFSLFDYNSFGEPNSRLWDRVRITKPETLLSKNIAKGITIAGVEGSFEGSSKTEEIRDVDANFSAGSQYIYPSSTDKTMSQVIVYRPDTLIAENVAENVNIAGITGTLKKITTEEKAIDLDFSYGDMSISADAGKAFSKVDIAKPTNLEPNNIINGVNIAGVEGTFEAPTLYSPTITTEDAESGYYSNITITMSEENGSFCNTLEVYDDNGEQITAYEIAPGESKTIKDVDLYNNIDGEQQLYFRATAKGFVPGEKSVDIDVVGLEIEGPSSYWTSYDPAIKRGSKYSTIISPEKAIETKNLGYLDLNSVVYTNEKNQPYSFYVLSPEQSYFTTTIKNNKNYLCYSLFPYSMGQLNFPSVDSKTKFSYNINNEKPAIPLDKSEIGYHWSKMHPDVRIPSIYIYKMVYTLDDSPQEYRIEYPTIKATCQQFGSTAYDETESNQLQEKGYLSFISDTTGLSSSAGATNWKVDFDFSNATVLPENINAIFYIFPSGPNGIIFDGTTIANSSPTFQLFNDFDRTLYFGKNTNSSYSYAGLFSDAYVIPSFVAKQIAGQGANLNYWYIDLPDYKEHTITYQFWSTFEASPSQPQTAYNICERPGMDRQANSDNEYYLKFYNIKTDIVDTIEVYINDTLVDTLPADATESALLSTYEAYDASIKNTYQIRVIGPDTDAWSEPYVET